MNVKCPYTREVLCNALFNALVDLNMDHKVSAVTVDNCSNNDRIHFYYKRLKRVIWS